MEHVISGRPAAMAIGMWSLPAGSAMVVRDRPWQKNFFARSTESHS